jgi:hypothetical protein
MAWLRHSIRHIHRSVYEHILSNMRDLGWEENAPGPFGASPTQFLSAYPKEFDPATARFEPNKVAIICGGEGPDEEIELGGVVKQFELPFICDIYADTWSVAVALSCDIRDILLGRFAGCRMVIPVYEWVTDPPTEREDWRAEFGSVARQPVEGRPEGAVVQFTTNVMFTDFVG